MAHGTHIITPEIQDASLAQRIAAGDAAAEAELFSRFSAVIEHLVRLKLGTKSDDWKDVANEAKVALLLSLREGNFDAEKGNSLGSYVYGITRFKILDYFRKGAKRIEVEPSVLEQIPQAAELSAQERAERAQLLKAQLEKLKPKYREILYLRYFKGMSVPEISEHLNLAPRRVSERVHYALKLLRKSCKPGDFLSIILLCM